MKRPKKLTGVTGKGNWAMRSRRSASSRSDSPIPTTVSAMRVRNALEPEWEAKFEARSYGFRPGRGCADAIGSLYSILKGPGAQRVWILDADLSAAFDKTRSIIPGCLRRSATSPLGE